MTHPIVHLRDLDPVERFRESAVGRAVITHLDSVIPVMSHSPLRRVGMVDAGFQSDMLFATLSDT